jgi:hypothetical protein
MAWLAFTKYHYDHYLLSNAYYLGTDRKKFCEYYFLLLIRDEKVHSGVVWFRQRM